MPLTYLLHLLVLLDNGLELVGVVADPPIALAVKVKGKLRHDVLVRRNVVVRELRADTSWSLGCV